jgi:hypothetical protein
LQLVKCDKFRNFSWHKQWIVALPNHFVFEKLSVLFIIDYCLGHTHEDIDWLFSQYARSLRHNNALTLPELIQLFNGCCVKKQASHVLVNSSCSLRPEGRERKQVYDFKALLGDPDLTNITTRHCFKTEVSVILVRIVTAFD